MLKVLLILAAFNGQDWEQLADPKPMPSVEECSKAAGDFLAAAQAVTEDDGLPVSATCVMVKVTQKSNSI